MTHKDLSDDLRSLADHVSALDFKALSAGIGLGAQRVNGAREAALVRKRASDFVREPGTPFKLNRPTALPQPRAHERGIPQRPPTITGRRRALARSLDLGVVLVTLLATSFAFYLLLEPAAQLNGFAWLMWLEGPCLTLLGPEGGLLAVGLGFFVYTLFFRLFAGMTLGELCTKSKASRQS